MGLFVLPKLPLFAVLLVLLAIPLLPVFVKEGERESKVKG